MKRKLAWLIILALILTFIPAVSNAADEGEMLITSDPIQGTVGEIVKVDFYCYPNVPEGEYLESLQFTFTYDPELLTLGSLNLKDDDNNLKSMLILGKGAQWPMWNVKEPGLLILAWSEPFGTEEQGFLMQLEFRVEKEGTCAFLFNSVQYSTITIEGTTYSRGGSYFINPVQTGGIYTEGNVLPEEPDPDTTFVPIAPVVETPEPKPTDTPRPSNGGHTVPQTSTLPLPTNLQTARPTGIVTLPPAVTPAPISTPSGTQNAPASSAAQTDQPSGNTTDAPLDPNATVEATAVPEPVAEATSEPDNSKIVQPTASPDQTNPEGEPNQALVIAIIAGIVVVILLAVLAIILVLVHNKKQRSRG